MLTNQSLCESFKPIVRKRLWRLSSHGDSGCHIAPHIHLPLHRLPDYQHNLCSTSSGGVEFVQDVLNGDRLRLPRDAFSAQRTPSFPVRRALLPQTLAAEGVAAAQGGRSPERRQTDGTLQLL